MIETAPLSRLPIRTFVSPSSDQLIREAIHRELDRGGAVYIITTACTTSTCWPSIRRIVPDARIASATADGRKGARRGDARVLPQGIRHPAGTTIIELGVDNPDVNTIIIDNADTLGLTQLYQLRGRVGRGDVRAYAYLLYQPHKALRPEARERPR